MNPEQQKSVLDLLHSLRTIHGDFSDKAVEEEHMQAILGAAVRAANSSSRQCYSIVRITDTQLMRDLCVYTAPQALLFLSDHTRLHDAANWLGHTMREQTMLDLITTTIDASLAAQSAVIAAKAMGIDSLVTNSTLYHGDPERFAALLDIPQKACMPLFAVLFGYPKSEPKHLHGRYIGPGLLHKDRYHRMTEAELQDMSDQYDNPENHMGLSFVDWRAKGYASYFDWFFQNWNPGAVAHRSQDRALIMAQKAGYIE